MEGARSRTVDDKYWQIRAKAGEIPSNHGLLHSRTKIHNHLIFHVTEFFLDLDHVPGIEPAKGLGS